MTYSIATDSEKELISGLPDHCPFCHRMVTPNPLFGHQSGHHLYVLMSCPNKECDQAFVAFYADHGDYYLFLGRVSQGNRQSITFSEVIETISPSFTVLYDQAYTAEQQELTEICGVGFRKALEFLVKDYCMKKHPKEKASIEKKFLGNVIKDYVNDHRVKAVATRAVWLGNDEAHYTRKWEGKDLSDLKKLIDLTVHWIEMEELTEGFIMGMPAPEDGSSAPTATS